MKGASLSRWRIVGRGASVVATVVPAERVVDVARSLASEISRGAPIAVRAARAAVRAAEQTGLDDGLAREREQFLRALATDDRREGISAFLEKRPPAFTGR